MKNTLKLGIYALLSTAILTGSAQTVTVPAPTAYSAVNQALNSRMWQRIVYEQLPSGKTVPHVQRFEEAATGLNFINSAGQLEPSKVEVDVMPDGTLCSTNGQHSVFWPDDIGTGVIKVIEPGGTELDSAPLCLSYWDGTNSIVVSVVTNATATLVSSNQVMYQNALGAGASLLYSYTKAGLEQDVVLEQQLPAPQGLNLNTVRLEMVSEFFSEAPPAVQASTVSTAAGDIENDSLTFGTMSMGPGKAFMLGSSSPPVGIERQWITQEGRQILVEEVPLASIRDELSSLPLRRVSSRKPVHSGNLVANKRILPPRRLPRTSHRQHPRPLRYAKGPGHGFVLDYQIVNGSVTNYTFCGDTTYYISSELDLFGTNNSFEGGAIIKYANGASIVVEGNSTGTSVQTLTANDRPVIFTCADDNTIGDEITGSTGNPSGYYANPALEISGSAGSPGVLSNLRISYAQTGIEVNGQTPEFFDVQFVQCGVGCEVNGGSATFENALFGNVLTNFSLDASEAMATNATFSGSSTLAVGSGSLSLGNCILANVTNSGPVTVSADYNGFYNSPAFGSDQKTNSFYPFQVMGGGSYYLTNCAFRSAGTRNIDPNLLADLQNRTTQPPIVYDNTNISGLGTLSPQAARETNSIDLGWAYDAIDYVFGGCSLTSNLTVTVGTSIGCFDDGSGGFGINLGDGGGLTFNGNATEPCVFAFADMVQEGGNGAWTGGEGGGDLAGVAFSGSGASPEPLVSATFTKWFADNYRTTLQDSPGYGAGVFKDCEFYNCCVSAWEMQYLTFTNCLFFRPNFTFWDSDWALSFTNENCTYFDGELALDRESWETGYGQSFWSIENTIFDGTLLVYLDDYNGSSGNTAFEYNAYNTNNLSWQTYSFPYSNWTQTNVLENLDSSDVMVTNYDWESGWFGDFYLPPDSPCVTNGSTTADQLGLYEFTTQTNQIPEGTNVVDIGCHFVATDTNGNPLDTYVPGIPNYIVDSQGNGMDTNGLPYWWEAQYFGLVGLNPNSDPDGDGYDVLSAYTNGINPNDVSTIVPISLGSWNFDNTNTWIGNQGQLPAAAYNLAGVLSWETNAVLIDSTDAVFGVITTNGDVWDVTGAGSAIVNGIYLPDSGGNMTNQNGSVKAVPDDAPNSVGYDFDTSDGSGSYYAVWVEGDGEGHYPPIFGTTNCNLGSLGTNPPPLIEPLVATNAAFLSYGNLQTNGEANFNLRQGTISFWFSPNWASTNASGTGPQTEGRFIEIGSQGTSNGWWGLAVNSSGTNIYFGTQTNSASTLMTNLIAPIIWPSNAWHQIVLTYTPTNSSLYLDGQPIITNGLGVSCYPSLAAQTSGFAIGSTFSGTGHADGTFEELATYNYPLTAGTVLTNYETAYTTDANGDGISDIWEMGYFGALAINTNAIDLDGLTTFQNYLLGTDPIADQSAQPGFRSNYSYTKADWLNGVSGARNGTIGSDKEGNVQSVSQ
jgi:hypothetical protein